jgi:hypothetical protein
VQFIDYSWNVSPSRPYIAADVDPVGPLGTPGATRILKEIDMDAKYNWLIDNGTIRVALNTAAFALWIAMAVGLLDLASRT